MKIRWKKLKLVSSIRKIIFIWVFLTFLIYALFSPGVKISIESFFLDVRTFFASGIFLPENQDSLKVVSVKLNSGDKKFSTDKELIQRFIQSLKLSSRLSPKLTVLLLSPPYDDSIKPLVDMVKKRDDLIVGVYDLFFTKDLRYIPDSLKPIQSKLYSADLNNLDYSRIVRSVPFLDYGFDIEDTKEDNDTLSEKDNDFLKYSDEKNDVVTDIGSLTDKNYSFVPGPRRYKTILAGLVDKIDRSLIDKIKPDLISFRMKETHSENILLHYKIDTLKDNIQKNTLSYTDLNNVDDLNNKISSKIKGSVVVIGVDETQLSFVAGNEKLSDFILNTPKIPSLTHTGFQKKVSRLYLTSCAISNVLSLDYLRIYKKSYVYIGMILLSLLFNVFLWKRFEFTGALILFFLMQLGVLIGISFVLQRYSELVVISDFIIVSWLSFVFLGGWKFRDYIAYNIYLKEKGEEEKQLAGEYDEFLERVVEDIEANSIASLNEVNQELNKYKGSGESNTTDKSDDGGLISVLDKSRYTLEELILYVKELIRLNKKVQKENIKPDIFQTDIKDLIEKLIENFKEEVSVKKLSFDTQKLDRIVVKIDRSMLKEILTNLISNAVKYCFSSSVIKIYTRVEKKYVTIFVSDYGIEIPEEIRDHVFEKFYRASDDNVRSKSGFGMGLYLSRYFASLIDGKLGLSESKGKNSVEFYLRIKR